MCSQQPAGTASYQRPLESTESPALLVPEDLPEPCPDSWPTEAMASKTFVALSYQVGGAFVMQQQTANTASMEQIT